MAGGREPDVVAGFLFWNALGGICWAISIALAAYFAGRGAERTVNVAGVGGAVVVVVGGLVLCCVRPPGGAAGRGRGGRRLGRLPREYDADTSEARATGPGRVKTWCGAARRDLLSEPSIAGGASPT